MKEAEYRRLKKKLEKEYQEKLAALDLVFEMSGGSFKKTNQSTAPSKSALAKEIGRIIPNFTGPFSATDLEQSLKLAQQPYHPGSVRNILRKMHRDGVLEVVTPAAGRTPAVYVRR